MNTLIPFSEVASPQKTFAQWLGLLPEPARTRAIVNAGIAADKLSHASTLKAAIGGAFTWELSPEGYGYWLSVSKCAERSHDISEQTA